MALYKSYDYYYYYLLLFFLPSVVKIPRVKNKVIYYYYSQPVGVVTTDLLLETQLTDQAPADEVGMIGMILRITTSQLNNKCKGVYLNIKISQGVQRQQV